LASLPVIGQVMIQSSPVALLRMLCWVDLTRLAENQSALVDAPVWIVLAALVVAGTFGLSWNGLSFTAAAEAAGRARSGAAAEGAAGPPRASVVIVGGV